MLATDRKFGQMIAETGLKAAFLDSLTDDSVIFFPDPVNGKAYWNKHDAPPGFILIRKSTHGDIAANGMLGYTTGNWRSYIKDDSKSPEEFGEYITIWEKRPGGKFRISLDIGITHDKLSLKETQKVWPTDKGRDLNKRGWSPADAYGDFLRMSMGLERLGGAYEQYAASDVRLLIEHEAPILGKKNVVSAMRHYKSVEFPKNVVLFQSADMAYTWNRCQYSNSDEGMEQGNCLQIWKLRKKKWWIVLGVFARVKNSTVPTLEIKRKNARTSLP